MVPVNTIHYSCSVAEMRKPKLPGFREFRIDKHRCFTLVQDFLFCITYSMRDLPVLLRTQTICILWVNYELSLLRTFMQYTWVRQIFSCDVNMTVSCDVCRAESWKYYASWIILLRRWGEVRGRGSGDLSNSEQAASGLVIMRVCVQSKLPVSLTKIFYMISLNSSLQSSLHYLLFPLTFLLLAPLFLFLLLFFPLLFLLPPIFLLPLRFPSACYSSVLLSFLYFFSVSSPSCFLISDLIPPFTFAPSPPPLSPWRSSKHRLCWYEHRWA